MAWQGNLYPTMVASGMCHLVIYFPKIYHGEEGALITFAYIQIRHPSHSSLGLARLMEISVNRSIYKRKTINDMKIQKSVTFDECSVYLFN